MSEPTQAASDAFYSDEALRKQAAARDWPEGTPPPLALLAGILEPRTEPKQHERCIRCGSDAREETGGGARNGDRWCNLCLGRGYGDDGVTPTDRIIALTVLCERVIDVHAQVVMDTPEDRELHDRAVQTFRDLLAVITQQKARSTVGGYPATGKAVADLSAPPLSVTTQGEPDV